MINAIIEFSARNRFVVFLLVGAVIVGGCVVDEDGAARRHPGSQRHAGDRLLALGSQSGHRRGSGHLSDRHRACSARRSVKAVRGFSDFGYSYVYVIFDEARTSTGRGRACSNTCRQCCRSLPEGVQTELGPDATGVGWVFQYALVDTSGQAQPRRPALAIRTGTCATTSQSVPGVAEVAPIGGFVRQYQVNVDPNRLRAYSISISSVIDAIRPATTTSAGGWSSSAARVHGARARLRASRRLISSNIVARATSDGMPVRVRDIGTVTLGPTCAAASRNSTATGEVVGGHRHHAPRRERASTSSSVSRRSSPRSSRRCPQGVKVVTGLRPLGADPAVDRQPEAHADRRAADRQPRSSSSSSGICRARSSRSSRSRSRSLISFIPMRLLGINVQHHVARRHRDRRSARWSMRRSSSSSRRTRSSSTGSAAAGKADYHRVIIDAVKEVGGPSFFSLLVIAVVVPPDLRRWRRRRDGSSSRSPTRRTSR